jgi:hypothetical protein
VYQLADAEGFRVAGVVYPVSDLQARRNIAALQETEGQYGTAIAKNTQDIEANAEAIQQVREDLSPVNAVTSGGTKAPTSGAVFDSLQTVKWRARFEIPIIEGSVVMQPNDFTMVHANFIYTDPDAPVIFRYANGASCVNIFVNNNRLAFGLVNAMNVPITVSKLWFYTYGA